MGPPITSSVRDPGTRSVSLGLTVAVTVGCLGGVYVKAEWLLQVLLPEQLDSDMFLPIPPC